MDYLNHLNSPQKEGVLHTEGPCMIIAGAGSGKTRVLTYRIAHLLHKKNVDPFSVIALTFTNKAAKEMSIRIASIVGVDTRGLWVGTFHAIFGRILRAEAHLLGYPRHFVIYDNDDTKALIRRIIKEMDLDDNLYKPEMIQSKISSLKNALISWQDYLADDILVQEDVAAKRGMIGEIYKRYVQRSFNAGAMDFDDLLFNTYKLLNKHLDVLHKYQHRIRYLLVDEFQDTNLCQYFILRKLVAVHHNICVVGDDAQSIYSFRGADIRNILNFKKDYPDTQIIKLEQNYRSTKNIVGAANTLIAKNKNQIDKNIWTDNDVGNSIKLVKTMSDNEEANLVSHSIFEENINRQVPFHDFVILYRTNSQSRAIEDAMKRLNIPYKIVGGLSFYQRKEVKDMLAYLRYALNQEDEASLRRIINFPKRGIGQRSLDKIIVTAHEYGTSIWEVLQNAKQLLGRMAHTVEDFVILIRRCRLAIQEKDAYEASLEIAKASGLLKFFHEDETIEGVNRYQNLQELLNAIKAHVETPDVTEEEKGLAVFLQNAALFTSQDQERKKEEASVTLMTVHMAKGLEFRYVYIVGLEENLFPSQFMLNTRLGIEEERRLFYVAITRAKENLFLSYALTRYRFGKLKNCDPSRFLDEIDNQYLSAYKRTFDSPASSYENTNYVKKLISFSSKKDTPQKRLHDPPPNFIPSDVSLLAADMQVEHPRFGMGKVLSIEANGKDKKACIHFVDFGKKTLLLSFAKLRIKKKESI